MQIYTTSTHVLTVRQSLSDSFTTATADLRCILRGHSDHSPSGAFSLGFEYLGKLSPCRIANAFREGTILHHPLNIQVFNRDIIELSDDVQRGFMVIVFPLSPDFEMLPGEKLDCFLSSPAAKIGFSRNPSLCILKLVFGESIVFRIRDLFPGGESGEGLNSDINAHGLPCLWYVPGLILFDGEHYVPTVSLSPYRTGLDCALYPARESNPARAYFRQMEFIALKSKTGLRVGKRVVSGSGFESRVTGLLSFLATTKERIEGFTDTPQYVLSYLRIDLVEIFADLFNLRKLNSLTVVINRNPADLPGIAPFLQRGVVKLTAKIKRLLAPGDKSFVRF